MDTADFPLYCITNRHLCRKPFLEQLEGILAKQPAGLILREKDLPPAEYRVLAGRVLELCRRAGVPCWFHTFLDAALELRPEGIQLPLAVLRQLPQGFRHDFAGKMGPRATAWRTYWKRPGWGRTAALSATSIPRSANPACRRGVLMRCGLSAPAVPSPSMRWAASLRTGSPNSGRPGRRGPC